MSAIPNMVTELVHRKNDRIAALETVLRALVEISPLYVNSGPYGWQCWYCDSKDLLPGRMEDHTPDCPWLRARALVGGGHDAT